MEGSVIFLVATLVVIWIGVAGYMIVLSGRIRALQRDLDNLKGQDGWLDDDDRSAR